MNSNDINFKDLDNNVTDNEIIQYEATNPFYISLNASPCYYTSTKILADKYNNVYILCLSNDYQPTAENNAKIKLFTQKESNISKLIDINKFVVLVQAPFSLVNLQTIRLGLVVIENNILQNFNHHNYQLNADSQLVYLMLESRQNNIDEWLNIYKPDNNMKLFMQQKIFSSYFNLQDNRLTNNLINLLNNVSDFKYWVDENNCKQSCNDSFTQRKFNLNMPKWKLPNGLIDKELENILMDFKANNTNTYPHQLTEKSIDDDNHANCENSTTTTGNLMDSVKTTDAKYYYKMFDVNDCIIDKNDVNELLLGNALTEREKYYLMCNLLSSKHYCHYVLNNAQVLQANRYIFNKYLPVFKYLIAYAWILLYREECIKKTRTLQTDRYSFDIAAASKLPVFPFDSTAPHYNPYFTLLVSQSNINAKNNINGVKQILSFQNGIVDLTEFKSRLNIFISDKSDVDLLAGVNWDNMVITGGVMAAILPKTNPLMCNFMQDPKSGKITDNELNRFFLEYYRKSDIDIACNHTNVIDFIKHVKHLKQIIHHNLGTNVKESEIIIAPHKSLAIYINQKILQQKCVSGEIPFDFDHIMQNKNKNTVKFYFYNLYLNQKKLSNVVNVNILRSQIDEDVYFELVNFTDFEKLVLVINDYSFESELFENRTPDSNSGLELSAFIKNDNGENFIKFSETLKYQITSKHFKHTFEIFRINEKDFFSCVSRFHLPCVRSYYNGETCFMLPSAITAYHTLTNIDFKYFVGSRDPINIIDKYRMRGYGTLLNKTEINQYISYILTVGNYKKAYCASDIADVKMIVGSLNIDCEFFKPRSQLKDEYPVDYLSLTYVNNKNPQYCTGVDDICKYYGVKYPKLSNDLLHYCAINNAGCINKIKPWLVDAIYDLLC